MGLSLGPLARRVEGRTAWTLFVIASSSLPVIGWLVGGAYAAFSTAVTGAGKLIAIESTAWT